jgi:hypothetical protein
MQTIPTLHRRVEPLPWHARPAALVWRRECALAGVLLVLLLAALIGPSVAQPSHYHDFADQRSWGWLPHAMDVISNLPFALWGIGHGGALFWRLVGDDGGVCGLPLAT